MQLCSYKELWKFKPFSYIKNNGLKLPKKLFIDDVTEFRVTPNKCATTPHAHPRTGCGSNCAVFLYCINTTLTSDHWKVVCKLYIKWYTNGYSGSVYFKVCGCVLSKHQTIKIVQSIPPKDLKQNQEIYFHHCHQALNLLLWSGIINTYYPM